MTPIDRPTDRGRLAEDGGKLRYGRPPAQDSRWNARLYVRQHCAVSRKEAVVDIGEGEERVHCPRYLR